MAVEEKVDILGGPRKIMDSTSWKVIKPAEEPKAVREEDGKRQGQ